MNFKIKLILNIALLNLYCLALKAEGNLEKGWAAFYKNDRKEARNYFQLAAKENSSQAEANLALVFIDETDGKYVESFNDFQNFFSASDDPYPYLFALWTSPGMFSYRYKLTSSQLEFVKKILNDPKANGTMRAIAYGALGNHYQASNNNSKAKEEFEKIASISKWQLAGEFENISESGFDKNYEPINNPDENYIFTNRKGAKVKWFLMKGNRIDKWIDLTYHFYCRNSIIYAQTFVNSTAEQQVQLRIGTSGSLKAWINDQLVISESKERNNDLDTYNTLVKLNKGFNRILLQIGSSEIDRSNFLLRLTDENGNPIEGLSVEPKYHEYKKAESGLNKIIKVFGEEYFENKIKQEPEAIINYIMLADIYLKNDKAYEARIVLLEAQKKAPDCSYIQTKLIEAYNRDDNETDSKIALEWLKEHDSENLISLNLFYNEEVKKENFEQAKQILDKIENIYGENEESLFKRSNLLASLKERDLMLSTIERAYKKYPSYYSFVDLQSSIEQNINKNSSASIDIIKKYLKDNYSAAAQKKLSDAYFAKGDIESGLSAYEDQLKHDPFDCTINYNLANYYYKIRNYQEAEKRYNEAISLAPYISYFWSGLATCYDEMGKKQEALKAYQNAIELQPTDYDSRNELRKLLGKPEIFSYFPQHDVYEIYKNAPKASAYPDDNSIILLNEIQKVVYNGGAAEEKNEILVKIFNQQGIETWKEFEVSYNSMEDYFIEKAEVIKANGNKIKAEINRSSIVFTSLEVGDAIYISYKIREFLSAKLAPNIWDDFYFNYWYPSKHLKYSLLILPEVKFKYKFSKEEIAPVIKKIDDFDYYSWEKNDQAGLSYENNMPRIEDIANILYISSFPDWKYISNWYYDLASAKSKADFEVKAVVDSLFHGNKNLSELEKAKMIYKNVIKNISYSSVPFLQSGLIPQKASKVINTKIGDCKDVSTLFTAMCREAGLKSDLVLVNTNDRGSRLNVLPSVEFNHCIARVNADGRYYYIELTSDYLSFNTFPYGLENAEALVIKNNNESDNIELIHLDPASACKNNIIRKTEVTINSNEIQVKNQNYRSGLRAAEIRSEYRDFGEKEQRNKMQQAINFTNTNAVLTDLKFGNLNGIDDTIDYEIKFNILDAINDVGGLKLLYLPWGDKASSKIYAYTDDRTYPIDLFNNSIGDNETETMTISIPSNYHLVDSLKQINISCPFADYSLSYKKEPMKLSITRNLSYKKNLIPVNEVKGFNDFYKKVIANDTKPIVFK